MQRHCWNDVQDEWPFYTEEEKALMRRRKPQNLTPPGSSDGGSSGKQYLFIILNFIKLSIYLKKHPEHELNKNH